MMHVMLDLETLGTKPGSVIFAIGAVAFKDSEFELGPEEFNSTFHKIISIENSQYYKFAINPDTERWWSEETGDKSELIAALTGKGNAVSVGEALTAFQDWLSQYQDNPDHKKVLVWGNGKEFDNALLRAYYEHLGMECPFTFRADMDFRTLKNLFPDCKPQQDNDTPHNSLADAKYQAEWLKEVLFQIQ